MAFLRRARNLGFSIEDCRQLMALYQDRGRASQDVREIAAAHVTAIEEKVRELQSMRATSQKLILACHGAMKGRIALYWTIWRGLRCPTARLLRRWRSRSGGYEVRHG